MKITTNCTYKPNFGYDKQLNEELKQSLSTFPDRQWSQTLSSMNSYCNKLENNLIRESKKRKKADSKFQDYLDIFLSCKQMLAGFVSITFDELNYADREFTHYHDEFLKNGSKENDWRKDACENLKDWLSPELFKKLKDKHTQDEVASTTKNTESTTQSENNTPKSDSPQASSTTETISSKLSPKSFLEEFKPDCSAPKGFIDVAGMENLKRDLREGIIDFIQNPEQAKIDFEEYGKTVPNTILLYGPPGCGKTYITQALASEIDVPLYLLNISKAGSHYINMTSKNLKAAFDEAIAIAENTDRPCLLFMDEIDSLGFDRNSRMEPDDLKQVSTMLQAIDTAKKSNVIIIGATNKFNLLDPAIRRRFDSKVFVDVPDMDSRKDLLIKNLSSLTKGQELLSTQDDIETIAKKLDGFSNSSICIITKQAALNAMRRNRSDISVEDFIKAIETTTEEKPDINLYRPDSSQTKRKIGFGF